MLKMKKLVEKIFLCRKKVRSKMNKENVAGFLIFKRIFFYTVRAAAIITAKGNSCHVNFIIVPYIYLLLILRFRKKDVI